MDAPQARRGLPLRLDPEALSTNPEYPPFAARPTGAPVYNGFPVLDDVEVDGFTLGMISDWEAEPSDYGDAFVVAPDGSRAGLMWEICPERRVREAVGLEPDRWGIWDVTFPRPMRTRADARQNLALVLPDLRPQWERWRDTRSSARFKLRYRLRDVRLRLGDWRHIRRAS